MLFLKLAVFLGRQRTRAGAAAPCLWDVVFSCFFRWVLLFFCVGTLDPKGASRDHEKDQKWLKIVSGIPP